ncbi:MAG TPA: branched-chain amino acid ABC transporter permease [Actinomycetes bacterium]|jgi:branched-chain amino acid transport system permease protein
MRRVDPRAAVAVVAGAVLGTAPLWARTSVLRTLIGFFTLLALATMWNLLAGYAGLVSIGQQAYIGVGAYGLYWLSDSVGLDPFAAVPLAALAAAVLSVPVAVLAFRLRGGYFAIGTWVIAETLRLLVANVSQLGGGSGVTVTAVSAYDRQTRVYLTYWLAFAVGTGAVALAYLLLRRRLGLALVANRDSETAARSLGVDVYRVKLVVYVVAAFGCALAGAVIYLNLLRIQPDAAFSVNWSAFMIFIVVIGGVGTIEGPIVGTVLFVLVQETLAQYGAWYLILLGLLAVLVALRARHGLWGLVADRTGISLFPVRRRLKPPPAPAPAPGGSP